MLYESIAWLIDWSINWLLDCLIAWLIIRSFDWLIVRSIDRLIDWTVTVLIIYSVNGFFPRTFLAGDCKTEQHHEVFSKFIVSQGPNVDSRDRKENTVGSAGQWTGHLLDENLRWLPALHKRCGWYTALSCGCLLSNYCIVPRCSVTFWIHPEIIPVGQFFRRWIKWMNQSIKRRLPLQTFWLIDWLIDDEWTLTWLVYWIGTVFTGAGLKRPNIAGQYSTWLFSLIGVVHFFLLQESIPTSRDP